MTTTKNSNNLFSYAQTLAGNMNTIVDNSNDSFPTLGSVVPSSSSCLSPTFVSRERCDHLLASSFNGGCDQRQVQRGEESWSPIPRNLSSGPENNYCTLPSSSQMSSSYCRPLPCDERRWEKLCETKRCFAADYEETCDDKWYRFDGVQGTTLDRN